MPELPEVETVRRTLEPVVGARIRGVWDSGMGLHMHRKPPRAKLRRLVGGKITALRRHGKYLLVDVDVPGARGAAHAYTLLVHLGMTGRLLIARAGTPRAKHTHVVLDLGARELRFVDARRFGQIDVLDRDAQARHPALRELGPDPLVHGIDAGALYERAHHRHTTLKAFVLDQRVIAGIGNIYASEALWRARLRPTMRTHALTRAGASRLAAAIREVLDNALVHNGTSLRDFVDAAGTEGSNADYLWVYGRAGQPCPRCHAQIRRSVLQGRATFSCPTCQTP